MTGVAAKLRAAGLTPRALAGWAGTDRLAALPRRLVAIPPSPSRAATLLELFVRGATLPADRVGLAIAGDRALASRAVAELIAAGLVEHAATGVRARVAVLPLGRSLVVCDRDDAPVERALVCWPDDSSHHLASALPPGRRARWLDLGCGSAFAPLARPELAAQITCVDRNPRAVDHARRGVALSGIAHVEVIEADLAAAVDPAELVTCNAPIPDRFEVALWRAAEPGLFARLFAAAPARVVPDPTSLVVIHAARDAIPDQLPGERVIVSYTPPGTRTFAVMWWRPHAPAHLVTGHRALTVARPHLDPRDRDDALARALVAGDPPATR